MGILDKAKARIAYEKGSWWMSHDELKRFKAQADAERQRKGGKR